MSNGSYGNDWKGRLFDKLDAIKDDIHNQNVAIEKMKTKLSILWASAAFIAVSVGGFVLKSIWDLIAGGKS